MFNKNIDPSIFLESPKNAAAVAADAAARPNIRFEPAVEANQLAASGPFDNAPIYYYGGHGSEICDPHTDQPIRDIVPDNCIYITITSCGLPTKLTFGKNTEEMFFRSDKESSRHTLRHPDGLVEKAIIARELHVPIKDVHVHMPGHKYARSYLDPLSIWADPYYGGIAASGLIEKTLFENMEKTADKYRPTQKYQTFKVNTSMKGSNFLNLVKKYYKNDTERHEMAERYLERLVDEKRYLSGDQTISFNNFFTPEELEKIVSNIDFGLPRDRFLGYFSASVFPTVDVVKKVIDTHFPVQKRIYQGDFKPISYLIQQEISPYDEGDPKSKLTNTALMKAFPGIHYNVVCRVVRQGCITALQRSMSSHQEYSRLINNSPLAPLSNANFKGFMNTVKQRSSRYYHSFAEKKRKVRNAMVNRADNLIRLSNTQKKNLTNYLTKKKIITNNNALPISKSIRSLIYPEKFMAPPIEGGQRTRKQKRGIQRNTRRYKK